uniref:Uncharacterized protein n=1 Tax=Oryza meridionalis TaxID=40149 RepID=A0A0E0F5C7_9ORYZ
MESDAAPQLSTADAGRHHPAADRCHPTCRRAAHHPSAIVHLIFQLMVNTLNSCVDSTRSLFVSLRLSSARRLRRSSFREQSRVNFRRILGASI